MEQLIDTLPLAVKIFVKERHPENSEEAAKYADDYWQARKGLNQEKGSRRQTVIKCENCGKKGTAGTPPATAGVQRIHNHSNHQKTKEYRNRRQKNKT